MSHYFKSNRFIVDSSLKKLALIMRNLSLDTWITDYREVIYMENKRRVFITNNKKVWNSQIKMKYVFVNGSCPEVDMKDLYRFMKLDIKESNLMTRCVNCNGPELLKKNYNYIQERLLEYQMILSEACNSKTEYLFCEKCILVFYKGPNYKKALEKYRSLIKANSTT